MGSLATLIAQRRQTLAGGGERLLSTREMARAALSRSGISLSASQISAMSNRKPERSPGAPTREALAAALRVPVAVVNRAVAEDLGLHVDDAVTDYEVVSLIARLRDASDEDRSRVLAVVERLLPEPIAFARRAGVSVVGPHSVEVGPSEDRHTLTGADADAERERLSGLPLQERHLRAARTGRPRKVREQDAETDEGA